MVWQDETRKLSQASCRLGLSCATNLTSGYSLILLLSIVGVLEGVPLRDGAPGAGQHVGPVAQLRARRVVAQHHLADGLRGTDTVVVHNRYH